MQRDFPGIAPAAAGDSSRLAVVPRLGSVGFAGNCLRLTVLPLLAVLSVACAVGPNYVRPSAPAPPQYKELLPSQATAANQWKQAQPSDAAQRGNWWELFGDPELNALEEQVAISNQSIAQAEAQFRGARALARVARAGLFPSLGVGPSVTRSSGVAQTWRSRRAARRRQ